MIDLRRLRQFVAVAETLNFRRAAARLNMAQPPLTVAVRRLEQELGVILFERTNRVVRLTPAGAVFLAEARRTLAHADRAVDAARRAGQGLAGTLRVGFVGSAAYGVLPTILRAFRTARPDVEVVLRETTTAQQVTDLASDRADAGFLVPPVPSQDVTIATVAEDTLVAALPATHPLAEGGAVRLAALADDPWILIPQEDGPSLHARIVTACGRAGFAPRVGQRAIQMATTVGMVAGGFGVALVPPATARLRLPGVVFRPVTGPGTPIPYAIALAWPKGRPSPLVAALLEAAQAQQRKATR